MNTLIVLILASGITCETNGAALIWNGAWVTEVCGQIVWIDRAELRGNVLTIRRNTDRIFADSFESGG